MIMSGESFHQRCFVCVSHPVRDYACRRAHADTQAHNLRQRCRNRLVKVAYVRDKEQEPLCAFQRTAQKNMLIFANNDVNRKASLPCCQPYIVCVRARARIPLHAVCPPGNRLGPCPRHPHVASAHGDLAGGSHHNLESSSERSRGAHERLETVSGTQTQIRV